MDSYSQQMRIMECNGGWRVEMAGFDKDAFWLKILFIMRQSAIIIL